ncbi:MAG: hypothetical protein WBN87_00500 [Thermoanaerobaculia bacterium]
MIVHPVLDRSSYVVGALGQGPVVGVDAGELHVRESSELLAIDLRIGEGDALRQEDLDRHGDLGQIGEVCGRGDELLKVISGGLIAENGSQRTVALGDLLGGLTFTEGRAGLLIENPEVPVGDLAPPNSQSVQSASHPDANQEQRSSASQPSLSSDQRAASHRVDQGESLHPVREVMGELDRDLRAETMPDEKGSWISLGIQDFPEVAAPELEVQPSAIGGLSVAAHIWPQQIPRGAQTSLVDELRPAVVIARRPVNQQDD